MKIKRNLVIYLNSNDVILFKVKLIFNSMLLILKSILWKTRNPKTILCILDNSFFYFRSQELNSTHFQLTLHLAI